jgi:hypothetical protein
MFLLSPRIGCNRERHEPDGELVNSRQLAIGERRTRNPITLTSSANQWEIIAL